MEDLDSDDAYEQEGRDIKRQIHQIQSKINQTQSQISALENENVEHHDDLGDAFARQRRWERARRQSASAGPSRPNPVAANTTAAHASTRTAVRIATPTTTHAIHTHIPAPFRAARDNASLDDPTEKSHGDNELARLADKLLRPNSYLWAVKHPEVMAMLQTIHSAFPRYYQTILPLSIPLSSSYSDIIPALINLSEDEQKHWTEMDTIMNADGDRTTKYLECDRYSTGKKGVSKFTTEERLALWGWWWNELLKESSAAAPDMISVDTLWQAIISKIRMPRAIKENKQKR